MEKEIEQTLQEMRRQSELRRMQMLQGQVNETIGIFLVNNYIYMTKKIYLRTIL